MKKMLCLILSAMLALPSLAAAEEYVQIKVPCAIGEELWQNDYQAFSRLGVRFADDKTPVPIARYSEGNMYATVLEGFKDRPLESYVGEPKAFTDDNGEYEFYIMNLASSYGIIQGDGEGRANPSGKITRAEATAMVLRFLGISESPDKATPFTDVSPSDWHAGIIASAYENAIVTGDSETTFSPNRTVTREELITMIDRAARNAGLLNKIENATAEEVYSKTGLSDANEISDWAKGAYINLRYFSPRDTYDTEEIDAEGAPVRISFANSKAAATRFEAALLFFRIRDNFIVVPTENAVKYGFDKEMPIIDGSTSTYPFTEAVYGALFTGGYYHLQKPEKHSKSHASYQRLINGEVDMLFASVYPASDILKEAEENGVELELIPIAYDAMIFFTNADNPAVGLSKEQISRIYVDNAYSSWSEIGGSDALLYPYCRNNDSGSHAQMEKHFLNGNEINEKIRQETTSISMSNVLTDVMAAQTSDPTGYALGYSIYYYFNNMDLFYDTHKNLKLLEIDGVYPTDETIANGSYPLSNNTYIVLRADEEENSPARKMVEFMLSDAGQECVVAAGYGPLKK